MGQLLLGFRSLLVKIAVFVIMAALLAWALGGTLWPRPVVISYDAVHLNESAWHWMLSVGGDGLRSDRNTKRPQWMMMVVTGEQDAVAFPSEEEPAIFQHVAEPVKLSGRIAFAGKLAHTPEWAAQHPANPAQPGQWVLFIAADRRNFEAHPMPDRLAVEQQLTRLAQGMGVQDHRTILAQRERVLEPDAFAVE